MKKLFQDFQTHSVCGWWKQEVPGQADMSCLLNYYSAAHQKQSFRRLRACSTRAARHGLVWMQRTGTLSCASSWYKTFGMGAGCGVRS